MLARLPIAVRAWKCGFHWRQTWRNVLFAHWRVDAASVQSLLPGELEVDVREGSAWVTAVAFCLSVRLRRLPALPCLSKLLELNLRTYVRYRGESGVFFLSMHADNRLAIAAARRLTPLPYWPARMAYRSCGSERTFESRLAAGDPLFTARFSVQGPPREAMAGSLDQWLLERYVALVPDETQSAKRRMCRMTVQHPPWALCGLSLNATAEGLGAPFGLDLTAPPAARHFSPGLPAQVLPFELLT
jgi:hypothetical protein